MACRNLHGRRSTAVRGNRRRVTSESVSVLYALESDPEAGTDSDTDDNGVDETISGKPYVFHDREHESSSLKGFQVLREARELFDVTLSVEGKDFPCHKALMASASEYFRCLFTTSLEEQGRSSIVIGGVCASSMELVLDYVYRGKVQLTTENVQSLLSAANLFQLKGLRDGCADYMERKIEVDNCIGIHFFAQAHECRELELQAWNVITENFDAVSENPEFLEMAVDSLLEVIKYDDIQAVEEEVFEAVKRWFQHRAEERSRHIYDVLQFIRFWLIDEHYLYDRVKPCVLLHSEPRVQTILDEVVHYKLLKNRWMETDLYMEPRYGADFCRVIIYTAYLDDEKKQVLQLFGQRSSDILRTNNNVLCDLPNDLENPALLVTGDNELYIAGGDNFGAAVHFMFKWCPDENVFEDMAGMQIARKQFCLVQLDKYIYAIGGCNLDGNLSSVSRYSEDNDEWDLVASMPKALRCFCAVPYKGKLYVFGGESEKVNKKMKMRGKRELNQSVLCYDPREDKWSVLAEMSTARALAGCTIFKNKIYVIGGFGTLSELWLKDKTPENCLSSVEIYDPEANSWTMGPSLPVALCAMGVVKYYGTIYVLGVEVMLSILDRLRAYIPRLANALSISWPLLRHSPEIIAGGENEEDVSSSVYYMNFEENRWDLKSEEMVSGVTETTIHSSYAVINLDMDLE